MRKLTVMFLLLLSCVFALTDNAHAVTKNGERWFVRAFNIDDSAYMYANGVKVGPDVFYNGDSGWIEISSYVNSKARNATVRFICWNGGGPYKYTFQLSRQFSGSVESKQIVKQWSGSYSGSDRTNRWIFDSGTVTLGTIVGDNFDAPTDIYPTARDGGYQGFDYKDWTPIYPGKYHSGADVGSKYAGSLGKNVKATAAGKVVKKTSNINGWGYTVLIEHNFASTGKVYSQYSHLSSISAPAVGLSVVKGQIIGKVGGTAGNISFTPHLHFEIKRYNAGGYDLGNGYYLSKPSTLNPRYFDPYYIITGY